MPDKLTVEELLIDGSFIDYCVNPQSPHKAKWEQWRAADPAFAIVMDEAKELLSVMGPGLPAEEISAEIEKFRELFAAHIPKTIDLHEEPSAGDHLQIDPSRPTKKRRARWILNSIAIAACITVAVVFLWPAPAEKPQTLALTEHTTGFGERLQVMLPDGSKVILNSNSSLRYNSDFNIKDRQLELSGEGYFDVAPDPAKKFIVSTGKFSSTAIGTAFYINGRHPWEYYSVNLLEGKLSVQNGSEPKSLLQAGQKADWAGNQTAFSINRFDSSSLRKWVDGKLQFQKSAIGDVLAQLADWYAVSIEDVRKKPGAITITGDYSNKPLEDILKAICFSLSCKYTITENKILIQ